MDHTENNFLATCNPKRLQQLSWGNQRQDYHSREKTPWVYNSHWCSTIYGTCAGGNIPFIKTTLCFHTCVVTLIDCEANGHQRAATGNAEEELWPGQPVLERQGIEWPRTKIWTQIKTSFRSSSFPLLHVKPIPLWCIWNHFCVCFWINLKSSFFIYCCFLCQGINKR